MPTTDATARPPQRHAFYISYQPEDFPDARDSHQPSHLAAPFLRRTAGCHAFLFDGGGLIGCAGNAGAPAA